MTQDYDDPWLDLTGGNPSTFPDAPYLAAELIGTVMPLQAGFGMDTRKAVPDELQGAIFGPVPADSSNAMPTYAILDAAKVVNLPERLDTSGLAHRCLFQGDAYDDLKDVAPWIVRLEDGHSFTRAIFTAGENPRYLWDRRPGIFLRSRADLATLWKHFRHFTMLQSKVMLRFYDPAVTYTIMDYLTPRKADCACWFMIAGGATVDEIIAPHRKPDVFYRYRPVAGAVTHSDVPPGRMWGENYPEHAREERELLTSLGLVSELRRLAQPSWLPADNKTLLFYVREARKAARLYGLTHPESLTKFVYLGTICAPFFWREPDTQKFLSAHRNRPDARFADFYKLFKRQAQHAKVPWVLPEH